MRHTSQRGFTFVETLVSVAVLVLFFGGLFVAMESIIKLITHVKLSTGAIALASERMEYIRSLDYYDVGTVAGIPSGNIPQNATTTLNEVLFHERILIQYVDSPDDGVGASDDNGIVADYKEVKVEYSWLSAHGTSSVFLVSNIVPSGIESTEGGGTLTVNVFDAGVLPVAGAQVRVYNDTTTSTIDVIRNTNNEGIATFAGAPAAANYEITVTKDGYSTDQTYTTSPSNPNPITSPVAVLESAVSTMNFSIDSLSRLLVRTIGPPTNGSFLDNYNDMSNSTSSVNVVVTGGELVLTGGAGAYSASGNTFTVPVSPSPLTSWGVAVWDAVTPLDTTLLVQVYSVSGSTFTLISDSDLSGNSVGFSDGSVSLTGLDVDEYPSIALGVTLTSSDVHVTPALRALEIPYVVNEPAIGNVSFTLTGNKTIGTDALAMPVYKYEEDVTTNGSGELQIEDMEWDYYSIDITSAYDLKDACPAMPYSLYTNVDDTLTLILVPATTHSLRVSVVDIDGAPIPNADVEISRTGFSDTDTTSACGQVFFNTGLGTNPDYRIDVDAGGYNSQTITDVTIGGTETLAVTLTAL